MLEYAIVRDGYLQHFCYAFASMATNKPTDLDPTTTSLALHVRAVVYEGREYMQVDGVIQTCDKV